MPGRDFSAVVAHSVIIGGKVNFLRCLSAGNTVGLCVIKYNGTIVFFEDNANVAAPPLLADYR